MSEPGASRRTHFGEARRLNLRELVRRIPPERLMVETDAPFLLPRDLKGATGRRNEPAYLPHVAQSVARCGARRS